MISSSVVQNHQEPVSPQKQAAGSSKASERGKRDVPRLRPVADAYESDADYLILMDVPGATQEHVSVALDGDRLVVRAERHDRGELSAVYEQKYAVPEGIERESVRAKLEAGALAIVLPKAAEVKAKQIPVSAG